MVRSCKRCSAAVPAALFLLIVQGIVCASSPAQKVMTPSPEHPALLDPVWDVLGPFPQAAREQHFLSPSFPVDLTAAPEYGTNKTYPSALADNGVVSWSHTTLSYPDGPSLPGQIEIVYPDVRWADLRSTAGWAALQHHSLLHSTITVPAAPHALDLEITLSQASFFCVIPRSPRPGAGAGADQAIEWHPVNIYGSAHTPPAVLPLPPSAAAAEDAEEDAAVYDIYVSAAYEIRLFGDPRVSAGGDTPATRVALGARVRPRSGAVEWVPADDVVPAFVDGWAMGSALGLAVRAGAQWAALEDVRVEPSVEGLQIALAAPGGLRIAPYQTRIVPLRIAQTAPLPADLRALQVTLVFAPSPTSSSRAPPAGPHTLTLTTRVPIQHRPHWSTHSSHSPLVCTYLLSSQPTAFLALPPRLPNPPTGPTPTVLALHGAGVELLSTPFWPAAVPRQDTSWVVFPSGGTSWGCDWHGVSAKDAWGGARALRGLLARPRRGSVTNADANADDWARWAAGEENDTVVIGHSNGGQGTWFLASRYPDRVRAALPASAWLTPPHYVPLTFARAAHFLDPGLRGVLDAAGAGDGNDLFLSNVRAVRRGVRALHGGEDENVPVWMGREAVGLARGWGAQGVVFVEERGRGHWWDEVFSSEHVGRFLREVLGGVAKGQDEAGEEDLPEKWTLTVANPAEAGSMFGWSVDSVEVPGRLARLEVTRSLADDDTVVVDVRTTNVHAFTAGRVGRARGRKPSLTIDRARAASDLADADAGGPRTFTKTDGVWGTTRAGTGSVGADADAPPTGPLSSIFVSPGPLVLVVPRASAHALSIATRLSRALYFFLRLDSQIVFDDEALQLQQARAETPAAGAGAADGNWIVLGGWENRVGRALVERRRTGFAFDDETRALRLGEHVFSGPATGVLFLHPHPVSPSALVAFVSGSDADGLERALRAFPLRTGVPVPQWLVVGEEADWKAMGGITAAGWWTREWQVSPEMSWFA